jgi:hypothetical protein
MTEGAADALGCTLRSERARVRFDQGDGVGAEEDVTQ